MFSSYILLVDCDIFNFWKEHFVFIDQISISQAVKVENMLKGPVYWWSYSEIAESGFISLHCDIHFWNRQGHR